MLRIHPLALLLPLSSLLLAACGRPDIISAPRPAVPDALLTCDAQPEPPDAKGTDTDLARWIVNLAVAGQSCRDNLASVKGVLTQ